MPQAPEKDRIIDAHIHVWTADTDKYPLAVGFTKEDLWRPSFTPEEHFSYSRSVGAVRLNMVQMFWYGRDHSYILDLVASDPETYAATGLMDLEDPAPQQTMVQLAQKRCFAFRLPAADFDHPAMARMFATGAEHNLALSFNMGVDLLPAMERLCRRFPQTPVILDHVCHVSIGEPNYTEAQIGALLRFAKHPQVMIKIGPLQGLGARQAPYLDVLPLIQRVVEAYGSQRCMWGSDSGGPIWMGDPQSDFPAAVALIRDHAGFLRQAEREDLLFRTAEGVFFQP